MALPQYPNRSPEPYTGPPAGSTIDDALAALIKQPTDPADGWITPQDLDLAFRVLAGSAASGVSLPPSDASNDGDLLTAGPDGTPFWNHSLVDNVEAAINRTDALRVDVDALKAAPAAVPPTYYDSKTTQPRGNSTGLADGTVAGDPNLTQVWVSDRSRPEWVSPQVGQMEWIGMQYGEAESAIKGGAIPYGGLFTYDNDSGSGWADPKRLFVARYDISHADRDPLLRSLLPGDVLLFRKPYQATVYTLAYRVTATPTRLTMDAGTSPLSAAFAVQVQPATGYPVGAGVSSGSDLHVLRVVTPSDLSAIKAAAAASADFDAFKTAIAAL